MNRSNRKVPDPLMARADSASDITVIFSEAVPIPDKLFGGWSSTEPATGEIQAIADQVRSQLEERENKKYAVFKAVEFKSQLVAGMNFIIKVQVDDDDFMHIRVYESLPHTNKPLALTNYQTHKARHDELAIF
ncbi:cystatin-B-like [Manis javanica]|uniref:cystatin-B-like n=1 Tax=Manis javanica TaxID=9974 RepID=UPI00187A2B7F|nr:cystatin-B-like [Manis javanica]KAI5941340.1 Cystatin-B [Manis javanica]